MLQLARKLNLREGKRGKTIRQQRKAGPDLVPWHGCRPTLPTPWVLLKLTFLHESQGRSTFFPGWVIFVFSFPLRQSTISWKEDRNEIFFLNALRRQQCSQSQQPQKAAVLPISMPADSNSAPKPSVLVPPCQCLNLGYLRQVHALIPYSSSSSHFGQLLKMLGGRIWLQISHWA